MRIQDRSERRDTSRVIASHPHGDMGARSPSRITPTIVQFLRSHFRLHWEGIHGVAHWSRVRTNGLMLATLNGARQDVVELFAFFHDCERRHDGRDSGHGWRAAETITTLNGRIFHVDSAGLDLLVQACTYHSDGHQEGDVTVRTCWDADRLDLGRVGIRPNPARLATQEARNVGILSEAYRRSISQPRWQDQSRTEFQAYRQRIRGAM